MRPAVANEPLKIVSLTLSRTILQLRVSVAHVKCVYTVFLRSLLRLLNLSSMNLPASSAVSGRGILLSKNKKHFEGVRMVCGGEFTVGKNSTATG